MSHTSVFETCSLTPTMTMNAADGCATRQSPTAMGQSANADANGGTLVHRVLWVNHHADFVGGCEQYMFDTARLLRRQGISSSLMYDLSGRVSTEFLGGFDAAFPAVDPCRQVRELEPDIVYLHRFTGPHALKELRKSRVPVITFFHDHRLFCLREHKYTALSHATCTGRTGLGCYTCLGFAQRSSAFPGLQLRTLGALQREQAFHRQWNGFVVASRYMADHVIRHGFDKTRLFPIGLYASPLPEAEEVERDERRVLFAGQMVRGKGVDILLAAICRLGCHARFVLAGDGNQRETLQKTAQRKGLGDRVRFLGHLSRVQLAKELRRAACFVMPSRSPETFGLAGLEAHLAATPVIASDVGGISEWLVDEVNGLRVPPQDPVRLAAAIDRLVENPLLARQFGEAGERQCKKRFSSARHVQQLVDAFQAVVRRAKS